MDQVEFFDNIKKKKMKEALITLDCGCQLLYSPMTEEVFGNPCPAHSNDM